jgi:hypothetical protein
MQFLSFPDNLDCNAGLLNFLTKDIYFLATSWLSSKFTFHSQALGKGQYFLAE